MYSPQRKSFVASLQLEMRKPTNILFGEERFIRIEKVSVSIIDLFFLQE